MSKDTSSPDTEHELFDLCKKVYELTGWSDETLEKMALSMADSELHTECPLYTSDYLLEKLPLENGNHISMDIWSGGYWGACWQRNRRKRYVSVVADTPLKSLLKLTIALSEAGELNDQSS